MQPYFFPYIGYFQLIAAVDNFVIYDDVNFIKGGWINRNRILLNDSPSFINIPILGASSFKLINEITLGSDFRSLITKIKHAYSRAPYFKETFPIIENLLLFKTDNLSLHLANSIISLANYFELNTEFLFSSDLPKDSSLKGQEKVISICKIIDSDSYINLIGGIDLYSKTEFKKNFIDLKFIQTGDVKYKQFQNMFISNLSIIDVMMFNNKEEIKSFLNQYILI